MCFLCELSKGNISGAEEMLQPPENPLIDKMAKNYVLFQERCTPYIETDDYDWDAEGENARAIGEIGVLFDAGEQYIMRMVPLLHHAIAEKDFLAMCQWTFDVRRMAGFLYEAGKIGFFADTGGELAPSGAAQALLDAVRKTIGDDPSLS